MPYRIAATSPSQDGLWVAVLGGLGVTSRTALALPDGVVHGESLFGLPTLGAFPISAMIDFATKTRTENDSLGPFEIPEHSYWDIHSARAAENFPITRNSISSHPSLIHALAMTKKAAARANKSLGLLDSKKADAISGAADAVIEGRFLDQFIIDVIQGGAGTSSNMNMNEVLANIGLERLGREKVDYSFLSPLGMYSW